MRERGRVAARPTPMRRVSLLATLSLGLVLAACADEPAGTEPGSEESTGTVRGTVLLGPTCPVETLTDPCSDLPLGNVRVQVFGLGGDVVATAETDAEGTFRLELEPGEYTVQAVIEQDAARSAVPVNLTVLEGRVVEIMVPVDSGIRTPEGAETG